MIIIGYGIVAVYLAALMASAFGAFMLGRQVYRSRSAALFFFLWGFLASLLIIVLLTGLVHGLGLWPKFPYLLHFHQMELHLHYSFAVMEAPLTICHHLSYLSLQLPPHTYLLPFLAIGIPLASFLANQAYMTRVHTKLSSLKDEALSTELKQKMAAFWPGRAWEIMVVEGSRLEALSYALFRPHLRPPRLAGDVVVVTKGLYGLLDEEEVIASLAHEFAHLEANDHRYLTFFKTLCSIVFFDPAVVFLSHKLCTEAEFKADYEAAKITRNPLALARALLKVYESSGPTSVQTDGVGVALARPLLVERIERLLTIAREMSLRRDRFPVPKRSLRALN
ncbi:MAG: M48 family metalloprotease [Thermoplasmata archaeon]